MSVYYRTLYEAALESERSHIAKAAIDGYKEGKASSEKLEVEIKELQSALQQANDQNLALKNENETLRAVQLRAGMAYDELEQSKEEQEAELDDLRARIQHMEDQIRQGIWNPQINAQEASVEEYVGSPDYGPTSPPHRPASPADSIIACTRPYSRTPGSQDIVETTEMATSPLPKRKRESFDDDEVKNEDFDAQLQTKRRAIQSPRSQGIVSDLQSPIQATSSLAELEAAQLEAFRKSGIAYKVKMARSKSRTSSRSIPPTTRVLRSASRAQKAAQLMHLERMNPIAEDEEDDDEPSDDEAPPDVEKQEDDEEHLDDEEQDDEELADIEMSEDDEEQPNFEMQAEGAGPADTAELADDEDSLDEQPDVEEQSDDDLQAELERDHP